MDKPGNEMFYIDAQGKKSDEVEGILAIADIGSNIKCTCWEKAKTVNDELGKRHKPVKMVRSEDGLAWKESNEWS